ncbi:MAG: hypothetical protein B6D36_13535 [Planctomycetes bacterium UTPLA1]|nr:MAG: hypothetical protein B6D36_13535 [Planctomycetes bacterium UTPLA1]
MAYDSARGVTVLFGGNVGGQSSLGDTWEWDGTNWAQRSPAISPPARWSHTMVYDSVRDVTVLFGGISFDGGPHYFGDTWEWNGTNWTQRNVTGSCCALNGTCSVTTSQNCSGTWANGRTCSPSPCPQSSAPSPSAREFHAMAYDSVRGVTVMFGGWNNNTLGEIWEWNGTTWTQRFPVISPLARSGHAMIYDSARGVTVLFGGQNSGSILLNDLWEWDGQTWTQSIPTTSPSARYFHAMVYDIASGVTILLGAHANGSTETWEWDGMIWRQLNPESIPPGRGRHAMAYDSARSVTVMFGGLGLTSLGDTWEYGVPFLDADLNESCVGDGPDIAPFVSALLSVSTASSDLRHADFNGNGVIDEGDVPGFTQKLLCP